MRLTKETIQQNISYIDEVAIQTMVSFTNLKPPQSTKDSASIARISYNQALEMLSEKLKMIERYELRQMEDNSSRDEEYL